MSLLDALLLEPSPFHVWIALRDASEGKGSGTITDPYRANTATLLDGLLSSFAAGTVVHLGPGVFETAGYRDNAGGSGWQIKAGMKIVGASMGATTLKLVPGTTAEAIYYAIGHEFAISSVPNTVDYAEISDLTIDCNLPASTQIACGAIRLMGSHIRIRRVKAKNWGNRTQTKTSLVFGLIVSDPVTGTITENSGMEDCVAIEPSAVTSSYSSEVLVLHLGGKDYAAADFAEVSGKVPFMRNCYVHSGTVWSGSDFRTKFRAISLSSCIGGVVEGNQVINTHTFLQMKTWPLRDGVIRNNFAKNFQKGIYIYLGSTTATKNATITRSGSTASVTATGHKLLFGDRVKILGVTSPTAYNGVFTVTKVTDANVFEYKLLSDPGSNPSGSPTMQKVTGADSIIVENNIFELAHETTGVAPLAIESDANGDVAIGLAYVCGSLIVRENKIRYVDGDSQSTFIGNGLKAKGIQNLLVLNNIIEVVPSNPLRNINCGTATYFNNKTPAGALKRGFNEATSLVYYELADEADEAFVLSVLRKK